MPRLDPVTTATRCSSGREALIGAHHMRRYGERRCEVGRGPPGRGRDCRVCLWTDRADLERQLPCGCSDDGFLLRPAVPAGRQPRLPRALRRDLGRDRRHHHDECGRFPRQGREVARAIRSRQQRIHGLAARDAWRHSRRWWSDVSIDGRRVRRNAGDDHGARYESGDVRPESDERPCSATPGCQAGEQWQPGGGTTSNARCLTRPWVSDSGERSAGSVGPAGRDEPGGHNERSRFCAPQHTWTSAGFR